MRAYFLLVLLCLSACERPTVLGDLEPGGELVVVTRNGPTTYYLGPDEPAGFDYELAKGFADSLGMSLRVKVAFSIEEVFDILARGQAHLAAAGLTRSGARDAEFLATTSYLEQHPVVVYKAGEFRPRNPQDLSGRDLIILRGSHHHAALEQLAQDQEGLVWREIDSGDTGNLLEAIVDETADVAILDSGEFDMQQRLYPRAAEAFQFPDTLETVWYMPSLERAIEWQALANQYLDNEIESGALSRLEDRYFGDIEFASRIETFTFQQAVKSKLPDWQPLIEKTANEFRMDWRLLAAIAYQESHWNPRARSPTGVRGMMMLTQSTAKEVGVTNRIDAQQSLRGGARFLNKLRRRLPKDIAEPDRTWMALAAYNVGMAHLEEARRLTEGHGKDPHLWQDVREHLPMLQNPSIYPSLRHGFARGEEAVTYVDNIRHYFAVLRLQELSQNFASPPTDISSLLDEGATLLGWEPSSL